MEFNGRDSFQSKLNYEFTAEDQRSLTLFYLPLLGHKAYAVYFLLKEFTQGRGEALCALSDCDIYELGEALKLLNKFGLLRIYHNDEKQLFKFLLEKPLNSQLFIKEALFGRLYLEKTGTAVFNEVAVMLAKEEFINGDDEAIMFEDDDDKVLKSWKEKDEEAFQRLKQRFMAVDTSGFDINAFLKDCSALTFPEQYRTDENLKMISSMATVYGIDKESMRKLFLKTLNDSQKKRTDGTIDWETLREKCLALKQVNKAEEVNYSSSPVMFLFHKQHELPVIKSEKRLLEFLQLELQLPNEVINCLIEYVLDNNDMKLNTNYVEKIAATWARQNVDTLEKARAKLAEPGFSSKRKGPDFDWEKDETVQDLEQIRRELFRED